MKATGLRVQVLFGTYGAERDNFISRSRIVLNHHFYKSQIFEVVRVFYLLHNEVAVVAEINQTTSIEDRWRETVRGATYENLVNECLALIQNEPERHRAVKNGLEMLKRYPQSLFTERILSESR